MVRILTTIAGVVLLAGLAWGQQRATFPSETPATFLPVADALPHHTNSRHLASSLYGYDNATDVIVEGGYIRVVQDVRGKYGSEGDYVMNRPLRGPENPGTVEPATA